MKIAKLIVTFFLVLFLAGPAWGGGRAEVDAVGADAYNFFVANSIMYFGSIHVSDWNHCGGSSEYFWTDATGYVDSPCYTPPLCHEWFLNNNHDDMDKMSYFTPPWTEAVYSWTIQLQMQPQSDIDVNLQDCVTCANNCSTTGPWAYWMGAAEQTGRYVAFGPDFGRMFIPGANPSVTVASSDGNIMDARMLPGLGVVAMNQQLYTSKAHWDEGIVLVLPQTGNTNSSGQTETTLKAGDHITVTIEIPSSNMANMYYDANDVILKYIGILGTQINANCAS